MSATAAQCATAAFVDCEEPAQPPAEQADHPRIGVREAHRSVALRPLARVQGGAGYEEVAVGEWLDAGAARLQQRRDLGGLAALERVRAATAGNAARRRRVEGDVAHPARDRAFAGADLGRDRGQRAAFGVERTRARSLQHLPPPADGGRGVAGRDHRGEYAGWV
jgi:hypothetical protein